MSRERRTPECSSTSGQSIIQSNDARDRKRRLTILLAMTGCAASCAPALADSSATAATSLVCTSDREPAPSTLPAFDADNDFDVQVRLAPGGKIIRITGDTVIVDKNNLGSLLSAPSTPKTGVQSLIIDARVIRLRGSIALQGGSVELLGEQINFERGAFITLLGSDDKAPRSLRMVAERVRFEGAPKRPFDAGILAHPDIKIRAAIKELQGGVSTADFWTRFTDSIDTPIPFGDADVIIGAGADLAITQAFTQEMEWPLYFAAKLRKHFGRAPFSEDVRKDVGERAAGYLDRIGAWRDPQPYATLSSILGAIRNDADLHGHGVAFTPKQDLNSQKADIEEALTEEPFTRLAQLIVATTQNRASVDGEIKRTRDELSELADEERRLSRQVDDNSRGLDLARQHSTRIDTKIEEQIEELKKALAREQEGQEDAESVKQWAAVGASAVVIAASAGAATPAVAAAAATGIGVTGELIYRHNTGASVNIPELLRLGSEAYAAADNFQKSWSNLKRTKDLAAQVFDGQTVLEGPPPPAGEVDTRKPLTKTEVTKRLLRSAADAAEMAKAIGGQKVAVPQKLSLSEMEDSDPTMRALLADRAATMHKIGLLGAAIDAGMRELEGQMARRVELKAIDDRLRAAAPVNDQENARWNANAYLLWEIDVQRMSDMVQTYRKSLYFETGKVLSGVANVLDYPNQLQSKIALGILDPLAGADPAVGQVEVQARLTQESRQFLASILETKTAVGDAFKDYLKSRAQAGVVRRSKVFAINSPSVVEREFVEALNGQIRQQIVAGAGVGDLLPAYIPYELPTSLEPFPERLIQSAVVRATFNVANNKIGPNAIEFLIIHPQYGQMRREDTCHIVDFRSQPTDWRYFKTTLEMVTPDWLLREPTKVDISTRDSGRFYTYLPARAPYFLVVNSLSRNWVSIPSLRSIEIGFEVMQ